MAKPIMNDIDKYITASISKFQNLWPLPDVLLFI
jgi:hypothetical protein